MTDLDSISLRKFGLALSHLIMENVMADPIDALVARLEATLKRQEAAVAATKLQLEAARKMVRKI